MVKKNNNKTRLLVQRFVYLFIYYSSNFEEVDGVCLFWVLRPCAYPFVRQEPCMLGFWNFIYGFLMEKYLIRFFFFFFFCPGYLQFWSYAPLNKILMKSDACHILWTIHIWIPHGKKLTRIFFLSDRELPPFLELCPFENTRMKSCKITWLL